MPDRIGGRERGGFVALELPADMVLNRTLRLPAAMSSADIDNALALQARTFSPFSADDLIWAGERLLPDNPAGGAKFVLVLASRSQVEQYVNGWREKQLPVLSTPEIWVAIAPQRYVSLPGWGLDRRQQVIRRRRILGYALVLSALALLVVIALTPTLKLRMQALQAAAAYEETVRRTAPVVRDREQVVQASVKLNALSEVLGERIDPLRVIDTLTQVLPDDAAIQALNLTGAKVSLSGLTTDTASLMQKLGQQPGFRDVKAPAAATRLSNSAKESFGIEFMVDPKVFGVSGQDRIPAAQAAAADSVAALTALGAASAAPSAPAASASGARR
ncbi:Fimbrial assembly protein (PilN) [compost metagenome]